MEVIISEIAEKELDDTDQTLRKFFIKHIEKISNMPPRRHLKFGLPYNVENVTKQSRLVYQIDKDKLYILHCFATHKEYEHWCMSFK